MQWFYKILFSSLIKEQNQRFERVEKKQEEVNQAVNGFASAMTEYAKHLESHTGAIQNLAKASEELKQAAGEQTKFLKGLAEYLENLKKKGG